MRNHLWLAAAAALVAVPAAAQQKAAPKVQPFMVNLTSYAALAPATPFEKDVPKAYREKDVLFALPVVWEDRVVADREIKVKVAGVDWTIKQGDILTRARSATGGNLATLPDKTPIYCGEYFNKKGGIEAHLLTLGLSSLGSRLSNWLQTCVVDSDSDGSFDQGFLVGTKKAPDRTLVPIEPVAYAPKRLEPIADARLEVVYYDGGPLIAPNFELHLFTEGKRVAFGGLGFPNNEPPADLYKDKAAYKKWQEETPSSLGWFFSIKSKKIPQTFTVGDARFTVRSIDKVAKTATITLDRDTTGFPISTWTAAAAPIYVYVYIPR